MLSFVHNPHNPDHPRKQKYPPQPLNPMMPGRKPRVSVMPLLKNLSTLHPGSTEELRALGSILFKMNKLDLNPLILHYFCLPFHGGCFFPIGSVEKPFLGGYPFFPEVVGKSLLFLATSPSPLPHWFSDQPSNATGAFSDLQI